MVFLNGGLRFTPIPHFSITKIIDPRSILIVDRSDENSSDDGFPGLACKRRKTDVSAGSPCEPSERTPISTELKSELPTAFVDVFEFRDRLRQLNDRLETLRQRSLALKTRAMKDTFPDMPMHDLIALARLRTETGLSRSVARPIRSPTITEVIWAAARSNVEHVLRKSRTSGGCNSKRLDISVNESTNVWSESNLYKRFAALVNLESYQLAVGAKHYVHRHIPGNFTPGRQLMVQGPQNESSPYLYHRNATDRYVNEQGNAMLSLIPDDEVILTVSLYHGVRGHKLRAYDMLSSQTLSALRDAFICPYEIQPVGQDLELKGSCFMLNGQLFPDFRDDACDYAEPLLHFFESYKPGTLHTTECIEQTEAVIGQLEVPIYSPGFLLHNGDCEHRLMITAIRTFDKARDCPYTQCYPVCVFIPRKRSLRCDICESPEATNFVLNTLVLPQIPAHLCNDCYDSLRRIGTPGGIYRSDGLADPVAMVFRED
ncbi:hypothetical protein X943_003779 [Babesia divergens]|uniref:snRNA-activating protein complex subunit 3 n=1 Tax=Babesia divergens TaxID=32595 RepID=A0AAD9LIN8_BABDI|nr:hypothetical protein X943_003779 [Babesia divergens]